MQCRSNLSSSHQISLKLFQEHLRDSPIKQENVTSSVEVRYMGKCLGRSEGLRLPLFDNPVWALRISNQVSPTCSELRLNQPKMPPGWNTFMTPGRTKRSNSKAPFEALNASSYWRVLLLFSFVYKYLSNSIMCFYIQVPGALTPVLQYILLLPPVTVPKKSSYFCQYAWKQQMRGSYLWGRIQSRPLSDHPSPSTTASELGTE